MAARRCPQIEFSLNPAMVVPGPTNPMVGYRSDIVEVEEQELHSTCGWEVTSQEKYYLQKKVFFFLKVATISY